jgi:phage shock protein PspC (stress-responsive transcriptional regulator)
MIDRTLKVVLAFGVAAGAVAIALSLLGGSHFEWKTGGMGSDIDIRVGAGGGFPSSVLGTISVMCLLLGSAFYAASGHSAPAAETGTSNAGPSFLDFLKKLRRSTSEAWLGGVCGGLGTYSPAPVWVWRAAFLVLIFCLGTGVAAYVILWVCLPVEEKDVPKTG